jgi:hypothetical protein
VVQQVLIEEHPPIDIAIIIIWIDMLAGDNEEAAHLSARIFQGKQVRQFHASNHLIGKIIAESLGANNVTAWDTYLFYNRGSEGKEHMPIPLDWAHQLDDSWANPDHFVWGDDLPVRLREITNRLIRN